MTATRTFQVELPSVLRPFQCEVHLCIQPSKYISIKVNRNKYSAHYSPKPMVFPNPILNTYTYSTNYVLLIMHCTWHTRNKHWEMIHDSHYWTSIIAKALKFEKRWQQIFQI